MRNGQRLACAVGIACMVLAGCDAIRNVKLFGGRGEADVGAATTEVFYATDDGVPVLKEPKASGDVLVRLARGQRVVRQRTAQGWALVDVTENVQGWVDNAKLDWRAPSTRAAARPAGRGTTTTADPEPEKTEPVVDTPPPPSTAVDSPPSEPTTAPAAAPAAPSKPPSTVFDPF